jgi:uncharacterized circularly permuted ATP-grasp superfamily protein
MSPVDRDPGVDEPTLLTALSATGPAPAGHWDDLRDADGRLRPAWRRFAAAASELDADALTHAAGRIDRQIHENGVTYNVYTDADGPSRPWSLDVLPAIIEAHEWRDLERGLRQAARLLNAVAADLYGAQRLVHDGVVPAAIVFQHPGFLRPCHGSSDHASTAGSPVCPSAAHSSTAKLSR